MEYRGIRMVIKRDVRHARYRVSKCEVELSADLEAGEDLEAVKNEMHEDLLIIVEEMAEKERIDYKISSSNPRLLEHLETSCNSCLHNSLQCNTVCLSHTSYQEAVRG